MGRSVYGEAGAGAVDEVAVSSASAAVGMVSEGDGRPCILLLSRRRTLRRALLPALRERYGVACAGTRREARAALHAHSPALVLADVVSLRFDLARFLEGARRDLPDLLCFLLLPDGADVKSLPHAEGTLRRPFTAAQVVRRLERLLSRQSGDVLEWRGLKLEVGGRRLIWGTAQAVLTPKQTALARIFLREPETLLTRARLMREVWGTDYLGNTRTLDVHIHWLRKALAKLGGAFAVETVRGKGYRLVARE